MEIFVEALEITRVCVVVVAKADLVGTKVKSKKEGATLYLLVAPQMNFLYSELIEPLIVLIHQSLSRTNVCRKIIVTCIQFRGSLHLGVRERESANSPIVSIPCCINHLQQSMECMLIFRGWNSVFL
jgi:hypothetical protein